MIVSDKMEKSKRESRSSKKREWNKKKDEQEALEPEVSPAAKHGR
jgi:hypothetical protein